MAEKTTPMRAQRKLAIPLKQVVAHTAAAARGDVGDQSTSSEGEADEPETSDTAANKEAAKILKEEAKLKAAKKEQVKWLAKRLFLASLWIGIGLCAFLAYYYPDSSYDMKTLAQIGAVLLWIFGLCQIFV